MVVLYCLIDEECNREESVLFIAEAMENMGRLCKIYNLPVLSDYYSQGKQKKIKFISKERLGKIRNKYGEWNFKNTQNKNWSTVAIDRTTQKIRALCLVATYDISSSLEEILSM